MERTPEAQAEFDKWMAGQSGYIGKSAKAGWWNNWETAQNAHKMMDSYNQNPGGQFSIAGSGQQQQEIAANLSQVGAQTGQNLFQTGQQQQDYYQSLQDRRNGGDAAAKFMTAQRNRNMANVGRTMAGKKVAGGVAAQALNSAQLEADQSTAAQLQTKGRQDDQDLFNYVKRQQKVEGSALAAGKDSGLANDISIDTGTGMFGTVICTELNRQGIMGDDLYRKDHEFGQRMWQVDPYCMIGYCTLAKPVVERMKVSPKFTQFVAFFALRWAKAMAGESNLIGNFIMKAGIPMCRIYGKWILRGYELVRA